MNLPPDMGLEEYFKNTFEKKLLLYMPQQEKEHMTASTQILEKRRELEEVEKARKAEKEEFRMKMESLASRREETEIRENQLKESLMKFDTFIKENDAKLIRARNKALFEREEICYKNQELIRLREEKAELTHRLKVLERSVKRLNVFYDYLRQVMAQGGGYEEPRSIITRHQTLTSLLQGLRNTNRVRGAMLETTRQNVLKLGNEMEDTMMTLRNKITNLQKALDHAKSEALHREGEYFDLLSAATEKSRLMGMVILSTRNMYLMVLSRRTQRPPETDNFLEQMDEIHYYLLDLGNIVTELQREERLAKAVR
ncbi:coiled-coil domain-containing protein 42 homolog [Pomacea canaliculata]|uniref:coiled-coil domain-containing protein 42 homolog n=1 Tax=Pomacea canaliculata TaxID=400727 RepID=UPI000D73C4E4|nr:coiled-coil domain-containing protein 42 homolog [Pomacea canaliculata]